MVYELKPPIGASPGVLLFTHKERAFFRDELPILNDRFERLRGRYILGMHWGSYHEEVGATPYIDFHLACPGTVKFREDANARRIPMCSRDFTPMHFQPMDIPKRWDILSIGHPIHAKKMAELLDVIRMCYDEGKMLDVLLICAIPDPPCELGSKWETEFFEKYHSLFSKSEREHIHLGTPVEADFDDKPLQPIPNQVLPYMYNASRGFTLFSQQEGESKVIHEALLCGTPVVVREDLRGGGRDYLDDRNSIQFSTLTEARDAFISLAERSEKVAFDPAYLRPHICEEYTVDKLEKAITTIFEELDEPYYGEIEKANLALKLPSHSVSLRPELRGEKTNDLRSRLAMAVYLDEHLGQKTRFEDRLAARKADFMAGLQTWMTREMIGTSLKFIENNTPIPAYSEAKKWYRSRR